MYPDKELADAVITLVHHLWYMDWAPAWTKEAQDGDKVQPEEAPVA